MATNCCTETAAQKPPISERGSSSSSTTAVNRSAPAPPSASGAVTPSRPSSPIRGQMARGMRPAVSHSSAWGATSLSMKRRTVVRNASWVSSR